MKNKGKGLGAPELTKDQFKRGSYRILDKYYRARDVKEAVRCVGELARPDYHSWMLSNWILESFEKKDSERDLLAKLIKQLRILEPVVLSDEQLTEGFASLLAGFEEKLLEVPRAAEYLGILMGKLVAGRVLELSQVSRLVRDGGEENGSLLRTKDGLSIFASVLETIREERSEGEMLELYRGSGVEIQEFLLAPRPGEFEEFMKKRGLQCLDPLFPAESYLKEALEKNTSGLEMFKWFEANASSLFTDTGFLRMVMSQVLNHAVLPLPAGDIEAGLKGRTRKYSDLLKKISTMNPKNSAAIQRHYIAAVQLFAQRLGHPSGLMIALLNNLYDDEIIPEITFQKWDDDVLELTPEREQAMQEVGKWLQARARSYEAEDVVMKLDFERRSNLSSCMRLARQDSEFKDFRSSEVYLIDALQKDTPVSEIITWYQGNPLSRDAGFLRMVMFEVLNHALLPLPTDDVKVALREKLNKYSNLLKKLSAVSPHNPVSDQYQYIAAMELFSRSLGAPSEMMKILAGILLDEKVIEVSAMEKYVAGQTAGEIEVPKDLRYAPKCTAPPPEAECTAPPPPPPEAEYTAPPPPPPEAEYTAPPPESEYSLPPQLKNVRVFYRGHDEIAPASISARLFFLVFGPVYINETQDISQNLHRFIPAARDLGYSLEVIYIATTCSSMKGQAELGWLRVPVEVSEELRHSFRVSKFVELLLVDSSGLVVKNDAGKLLKDLLRRPASSSIGIPLDNSRGINISEDLTAIPAGHEFWNLYSVMNQSRPSYNFSSAQRFQVGQILRGVKNVDDNIRDQVADSLGRLVGRTDGFAAPDVSLKQNWLATMNCNAENSHRIGVLLDNLTFVSVWYMRQVRIYNLAVEGMMDIMRNGQLTQVHLLELMIAMSSISDLQERFKFTGELMDVLEKYKD